MPHPFAAEEITKGGTIRPDDVEWRDIPVGLLDMPVIDNAVAARRLLPGEPILVTSIGTGREVPDGWWSVPLALPDGVGAAGEVRIVTVDPPLTVDGIVVSAGEAGAFGGERVGLVAVPGEAASAIAVAAMDGTAMVLFAP